MFDDVSALFTVSVYVEAMLGLLLLFAWVQNTNVRAVAWWGSAHLLRAGSITLFGMYGRLPDVITIDIANSILLTSFAVTWIGTRLFGEHKPNFAFMFGGAKMPAPSDEKLKCPSLPSKDSSPSLSAWGRN